MKEVSKINKQEVSKIGKRILDDIRNAWMDREIEREVTGLDENGEIIFVKKRFTVKSPIKRLNGNLPSSMFYDFVNLVKPDEVGHIQGLISAGTFEVEKALQAFDVAPRVVIDKKIQPATWDQSDKIKSPSIATLVKYKGDDKAEKLIHLMLMKFAKSFGKRNDLDEDDVNELSGDIVASYRSLTISDVKMILRDAIKTSKKTYSLDYQTVIQLFDDALDDRMNHFAKKSRMEHLSSINEEKYTRERKESGNGLSIADMKELIENKTIINQKLKSNEKGG